MGGSLAFVPCKQVLILPMSEQTVRLRTALMDRYRVDHELGSGGMATVYLGLDLKHQRRVAIKLLRPDLDHSNGRERFLREIETLSQLRHPHVLPLLDSGVVDDLCFFIMPYCEGESLRSKLQREGPLPIDEAIQYACEIADALSYAHSHGVIHRDVKPQNIMIESRHAVLADFGIALAAAALPHDRITSKSHSLGTPHYMSPEQASSAPNIDGRSDIYSLGCVVYEMLVGEPPFQGPSLLAIVARHAVDPPPRIRVVRDTVSNELEDVVHRALAKAPADRFATADDFRTALLDAQNAMRTAGAPHRHTATSTATTSRRELSSQDTNRPWYTRVPSLLRLLTGGVLAALALSTIGLLTVAAFDAKLQMPARYTPSSSNFLLVGLRSLVVPTFTVLFSMVVWLAIRFLAGMSFRAVTALTGNSPRQGTIVQSVRDRFRRFLSSLSPKTLIDVFFLLAVLASVVLLFLLSPLFIPLFTPEIGILQCEHRAAHRILQPSIAILIMVIGVGWWQLTRWLGRRVITDSRPFSHWRTGIIVGLLVIAMTLPWRLMWIGWTERVRVGDERGYLLKETDTELIIYNADRKVTTAYSKTRSDLVRLGIHGYVFEEPGVFESGISECQSVTAETPGRP